jgi:NAD(P)-dependent dehydrogenase (short-subunit alcohol dehydrogenase family)
MSDSRGIIVTGGTGALGRALVSLLLERGHRVVVPWRHEKGWKELQSSLGRPTGLLGRRADLEQEVGARTFLEWAVGELSTLHGMALTAGGWAGGARFEEAPDEEWDSMLRSNLATASRLCRLALPHLLEGGGSVVTVGARAAEVAGDGMAAYAVSKSAVHALTRVLARENRGRGVRFNCVLPGVIDTPGNRAAMPDADRSGWTTPEAIARVVVFLLSPESAAVTGALVPVDGPA